MKAYKLTGYTPYWIDNDTIINFTQIEELLQQINITNPWEEIARNNYTWDDTNNLTFIDTVDSPVCYIKIVQNNTSFYFKKSSNNIINTISKGDTLMVRYKFELDLWNTYIHDLLKILLDNHCTVHFKRCFLDRLLRLNGKYVLNFKLQKYLSDIIPMNNLTTIRDYVNGTNAEKIYNLNKTQDSYTWDNLPTDYPIQRWDDSSQIMHLNVKEWFASDDNISGDNHRFCYIIAKSSALRKVNNDHKDLSTNTSQSVLIIPLPPTHKREILHGINDIGVTLEQPSAIILGNDNVISSKLCDIPFTTLFDWHRRHLDISQLYYASNKLNKTDTSAPDVFVNIPFFQIKFNQPIQLDIFNYATSNGELGIGKKIRDLINNLDKIIPESEPLLLNPQYYFELYNNGLTYYSTSFGDLNLEFTEGAEYDYSLNLSAYFNFFNSIDMSFYFGDKTNLYNTDLDNTNTKTIDIGIPFGLSQGASAIMLEQGLNSGYVGLLNRQSEEQQAFNSMIMNALSGIFGVMGKAENVAQAVTGGISWVFDTMRNVSNYILEQQRANNNFYASIKNTINSPNNINTSPYSKANIPLTSIDNNYLFMMYAIFLHPQSRDIVMSDVLHNGYVYDARDDINKFVNRKYMNVLSFAGTDSMEDIFSLWEKEYNNPIFKNKYWYTLALGFLSQVHKCYMTPYLVNCTDWKRPDYVHNIEIESYNIPTIKQNINSIIEHWPDLFPANVNQIWQILKEHNTYLTDEVIDNCDIHIHEYKIIINAKKESTVYTGQVIIFAKTYNLGIEISSKGIDKYYHVYNFNDLNYDSLERLGFIRTVEGIVKIDPNNWQIYKFDMIDYPTFNYIEQDFLENADIYCPIQISEGILKIGNYFISCNNYHNQGEFHGSLTLPNSLTELGNYFLHNRHFIYANYTIVIPNSVRVIDNCFMNDIHNFKGSVNLPNNLQVIRVNFMNNTSFNQALTLPNSLTHIADNFMVNCESFNQPLTLPNSLTHIGESFMVNCESFNQPLTLPNSLTHIGESFLWQCKNYTSTINFQDIPSTAIKDSNYSFATWVSTDPAYVHGIHIDGTYKNDIRNKFPDSNEQPFRRLITDNND